MKLIVILTIVANIALATLVGGIANAGEYSMPALDDDIIGENYTITVNNKDSLTSIREKNDVSYEELVEANPGVNFYKLKVGQELTIPKRFILPEFRNGIVINIPELRLYYFTPDGKNVYTFPIGLGREGWRTPTAATKVVSKEEDPVWIVPKSIHDYVLEKTGDDLPEAVPPGPKNPLGKYALHLSINGYLIHGTNAPHTVGTFISSGCMRLLREPIELLYQKVQVGTPVHIIHYPYKAGWSGSTLYLESHKPVDSYTQTPQSLLNNLSASSVIYKAIRLQPATINWQAVDENVNAHLGIPKPIGSKIAQI